MNKLPASIKFLKEPAITAVDIDIFVLVFFFMNSITGFGSVLEKNTNVFKNELFNKMPPGLRRKR